MKKQLLSLVRRKNQKVKVYSKTLVIVDLNG